jgi:hypothetical protein
MSNYPHQQELLDAIRAMVIAFDLGDAVALARAAAHARKILDRFPNWGLQ